jgi:hypothetical protein
MTKMAMFFTPFSRDGPLPGPGRLGPDGLSRDARPEPRLLPARTLPARADPRNRITALPE